METEVTPIQKAPSRKKLLFIGICLVLVLMIIGIGTLVFCTQDRGVFFPQVSVHGIPLSGLTPEEGKKRLEDQIHRELTKDVSFQIPGEKQALKLQLRTLGMTYNLQEALDEAWNIGREGNFIAKTIHRLKARVGYEIPLKVAWDDVVLHETLTTSFRTYNIAPKDASFEVTDENMMLILPEHVGREVELDALTQEIKKLDLDRKALNEPELPTIAVPFHSNIQPSVTANELEALKITGAVSRYTTLFDSGQLNRTENIRLASKALDKKILAPDEVFSFNQSVGERTVEAGYKEAMIIEGDVFTPGLGGGICQVSSTLYNAVILGHLEVTERHPHSLPISYVPPGQDATVSYPVLDLKFKNNSGGYLLIRSHVEGNSLTFELYGNKKNS